MKHPAFDKLIKSLPEEPATTEQLKALEEKLAVRFSAEQMNFLIHYQGTRFQTCEPVRYEGYFQSFLSLIQIEDRRRFLKTEVEKGDGVYCYTDCLLPIVETNFYSEFLCLSISPNLAEGVWAMDYEIDLDDLPKSEWKARIVHMANSVDEFLTICANNVCED